MVNFKKFLAIAMLFPILAGAEILTDDGTTATFSIGKPRFAPKPIDVEKQEALDTWKKNLVVEYPNDEIFVMKDADGGIIISAGGDKQKATISLVDREGSGYDMSYQMRTNIAIQLVPCEKDCGENIVGREKNDYSAAQSFDHVDSTLARVADMRLPYDPKRNKYYLSFSNYGEKLRIAKIVKILENSIKIFVK